MLHTYFCEASGLCAAMSAKHNSYANDSMYSPLGRQYIMVDLCSRYREFIQRSHQHHKGIESNAFEL